MKPPAVPDADFAVHASVYGELLIRSSPRPRDHTPLLAASAATPFPHSGSTPSAAARPSLDAQLGCLYVAPVLPLFCPAYLARPSAPFFPEVLQLVCLVA
jgi:hypothetical protein